MYLFRHVHQGNNSNPFLAYNWSFLILYRVRSCQLVCSDLIRPPKPPAKILCSLILPIFQLERLGPHGPTWPHPAPLGAGTLDLHSLIWADYSVARILTLHPILAAIHSAPFSPPVESCILAPLGPV